MEAAEDLKNLWTQDDEDDLDFEEIDQLHASKNMENEWKKVEQRKRDGTV